MKIVRLLVAGFFLVACGGRPHQLKDGSYQIDCEDTLANCTRMVANFCSDRGGYQIMLGDEKNTLMGVPGHQKGYLLARIVFICSDQATPKPLKLPARAPVASAEPVPSAVASERACVPGSTQRCVGPGACEGGQACLSDGSGYGPCECAPAATGASDSDGGTSAPAREK